jgi:glycosyltransferase involved in cell wall biosynthesis
MPRLLLATEAALENPHADPLSDADMARVNGVYRTYENLLPHLRRDFEVATLTPFSYPGPERGMLSAIFNRDTPFAAPRQNSIRLVVPSADDIGSRIDRFAPDFVHAATEGPLGMAVKRAAQSRGIPVSTAFHTRWHDYIAEDGFHVPLLPRTPVATLVKSALKNFHKSAQATMAATPELRDELCGWGLTREKIHLVSRGVDTDVFTLYPEEKEKADYVLSVGRLAPGKGVDRFCELETHGLRKVVVGTGPLEAKLRDAYPDVEFVGFRQGAALARLYSGARIFVLPSDTETFGMTVIESLACGTPVAALNRGGHMPILNAASGLGVMDSELQTAFDRACSGQTRLMPPEKIASFTAETRSWKREAENFAAMLHAARAG